MAQVVRAFGEWRGVLDIGQHGEMRTVPHAAVSDGGQLAAADTTEHAPIGAGADCLPGHRKTGCTRRDPNTSPFPLAAALELAHLTAGTVVGPLRSDPRRGGTELQFSPAVRRFLPALRLVVPDEPRKGDVSVMTSDWMSSPRVRAACLTFSMARRLRLEDLPHAPKPSFHYLGA